MQIRWFVRSRYPLLHTSPGLDLAIDIGEFQNLPLSSKAVSSKFSIYLCGLLDILSNAISDLPFQMVSSNKNLKHSFIYLF